MAYTTPVLTASGITFATWQISGLSGHLEALIAAQAGTAAPTAAPTLAESGSSGTLAATTYYVVITESDGIGETTASPASAGLPITSTGEIVVTFPSLKSGNISRSTYVGTSATGPFTLASEGVTASTVTIGSLPAGGAQPPTTNQTNLSSGMLSKLRSFKDGNSQEIYRNLSKIVANFNAGEPMGFDSIVMEIRKAHVVYLAMAQLCQEAAVLADANAGTLGTNLSGIGQSKPRRTWP